MRVGLVQLCSTDDVEANLAHARDGVREATGRGAGLVALPEAFAFLRREGEPVPDPAAIAARAREALREWAAGERVWLLGGTIPEPAPDGARVYNTSLLLAPTGAVVARYRKIHLFDVDLGDGGGGRYRESDQYAAGSDVVVADAPFGRVGLSVCYDLRFPELYRAMVDRGARWLCVPSAFTRETGAAHWEILLRARAIESPCYVRALAQCGVHAPRRASFGHSLVVDPWGVTLASAADEPAVLVADCPLEAIDRVRSAIPALRNRRL